MDLPAGFLAGLAQDPEEPVAVRIILKDGLAPVAPVHDVVDRTGILDSQFARHDPDPGKTNNVCQ